ncbi:HNH endonuclease [Methanohalobium evestigatum Z-7303]|uniref:HNH endonuclease n=1 Tax=Methanohalobium evestigatum (strain ATCC BAA-1072 / DSM 3721 / NBRC 107634 / OCM 161 / Z-7303) TaxID=644295 RepID=D7E7Q4_METEZ|nr:RNA-guided endonuclease IscB [Methanohalobium evestigatum]ADI74127.1 HNH endonuclease [Methanohalobium evestigatum Z-7303]
MVFVLNKNKKFLTPCHPAKARILLKARKATIHKKYPFTIRLKELKSDDIKDDFRLKIDYGSKHTGLAILKNNKDVIWLAQIHHRTDIKKKLDDRRSFRRRRRSKNLRYRKPRFDNRKKPKGWLPPSLQSRVDNIQTWVRKLMKLIPINSISYENIKFDTQLMQNPEIKGVEYQQGTLKGYEVREYLLEKFQRTCAYCDKQNVQLEVEHIVPRSRGGSDRVSNLTIACHDCNQRKSNLTAEEFGYPEVHEKARKSLKDAAVINATKWKVLDVLKNTGLPVECGTGALTKMNRIKLNLPKDHHFDACCVGESTPDELRFKTNSVLHIHAKGRGSYKRCKLDKYGFPRKPAPRIKYIFGFQSGDIIKAIVENGKYKGTWKGAVTCRSKGYFDIKNGTKRIAQGINHKYFKLVQRFDGYTYQLDRLNLNSNTNTDGRNSSHC